MSLSRRGWRLAKVCVCVCDIAIKGGVTGSLFFCYFEMEVYMSVHSLHLKLASPRGD